MWLNIVHASVDIYLLFLLLVLDISYCCHTTNILVCDFEYVSLQLAC